MKHLNFFLLVLAFFLQSQASRAQYFEQLGTEGVGLMAAIRYGMIDQENYIYAPEGYYELQHDKQYQPDLYNPRHRAFVTGGACYCDSLIYSNEYDDGSERTDRIKPQWRVYKAENFELVSEHILPDNCAATTTGLTYDHTEGVIYGFNVTYTETYLVRINPATGEMTRVGDMLDRNCKYLAIACRKDGTLFCIYMNKSTSTHYLARIRKSDGRIATIGVLSCGGFIGDDPFVNGGYLQCMWFNNANDRLFWLHQSASSNFPHDEYTPIMEIDVQKCSATMVAYFPQHFLIGGTFFVEPSWSAPSVIEDFSFTPTTDDRLTGVIAFKAPAKDYVGRPLEGKVRVQVKKINGTVLLDREVEPGARVESDAIKFSLGNTRLQITAINAAGEQGPTVERKFYAGYDLPKAPTNITLTAEDLTTTLTWDTPTEGVNGQPIAPETFSYNVVRYPGEVLVATGLKECRFVETHPSDMTRYVYSVYAVDMLGRAGKSAFSNNLIVGTPLTVPYGGMFTEAADLFNYYTILDTNNDRCTWTYDLNSNSAMYAYSEKNNANDWLIAPPIIYEEGKEYVVAFGAYSSMRDYPEALELLWGTGRTPDELNECIFFLDEVPDDYSQFPTATYVVDLPPVERTGVYYYAFHCVSPAFCEYLYLYNIRVREKNDPDAIHHVAAPDATPYACYDLAGRRIKTLQKGVNIVNRKKVIK